MIRSHRRIHQLVWLFLLPTLLAAILAFSNTSRNLLPVNEQAAEVQPKGALP